MKQSMILLAALLLSTGALASSFSNTLGTAWKSDQLTNISKDKNNINMVYGGEDISRKPTLVLHTASA